MGQTWGEHVKPLRGFKGVGAGGRLGEADLSLTETTSAWLQCLKVVLRTSLKL